MCHWIVLHFHDWIDYHGVAFSMALLEWDCTLKLFLDFCSKKIILGIPDD